MFTIKKIKNVDIKFKAKILSHLVSRKLSKLCT